MRRTLVLQLFFIASFAAACSIVRTPLDEGINETRTLTDDLGRSVILPAKIERAVSLAPSLTEMIFAAGAGERLVGVTTYCNFPEEANAIQKVGDTLTPNIERIIALDPQVVFVSTASQLEAFMSTLAERNIAVFVTNPTDLDGVYRNLNQLGEMLGTRIRTEAVVAEMRARSDRVTGSVRVLAPQRVFVQISKDPLFTIGSDAFLTKIIGDAGGVSITKEIPTGYPKLSKETALALNPDVIILSDSEDNKEPNDVFKNSRAVKNGRVYRINADIISRPGPRLVDAIEQIAGFLHGDKN